MKTLTNSKAVNRELSAMATRHKIVKSTSIENRVFMVLGVLLIITIVVNVLVYGIPNI